MVSLERSCHRLIFERSCNFLRRMSESLREHHRMINQGGFVAASPLAFDPVALGYACTSDNRFPNLGVFDSCGREPARLAVHTSANIGCGSLLLGAQHAVSPEQETEATPLVADFVDALETVDTSSEASLVQRGDRTLSTLSSVELSDEDMDERADEDTRIHGTASPSDMLTSTTPLTESLIEPWHVCDHHESPHVSSDPNTGDWIMLQEGLTYAESPPECT